MEIAYAFSMLFIIKKVPLALAKGTLNYIK